MPVKSDPTLARNFRDQYPEAIESVTKAAALLESLAAQVASDSRLSEGAILLYGLADTVRGMSKTISDLQTEVAGTMVGLPIRSTEARRMARSSMKNIDPNARRVLTQTLRLNRLESQRQTSLKRLKGK